MGQKVHPYGMRLGIINKWKTRWYAKKADFHDLLIEDIKIKGFIKKRFFSAAVSKIETERASERLRIIIYTARPGVIIGRRGQEIESLKDDLAGLRKNTGEIFIDIKEVKEPSKDAQLIAENIAFQLEKRVSFRRALKKSVQLAKDAGCEGIKLRVKGRIGGAEIARTEKYKFGKVPLQTLRADIDYGFTEAHTAYGLIGVKVWVYKGEKYSLYDLPKKEQKEHGRNGINAEKSKI